ncbi:hypothetical protein J6590_000218 [Homalodisca vitripennis]|nr:hypothetical protein J6590_000218 [Homalodisca vitripennis]
MLDHLCTERATAITDYSMSTFIDGEEYDCASGNGRDMKVTNNIVGPRGCKNEHGGQLCTSMSPHVTMSPHLTTDVVTAILMKTVVPPGYIISCNLLRRPTEMRDATLSLALVAKRGRRSFQQSFSLAYHGVTMGQVYHGIMLASDFVAKPNHHWNYVAEHTRNRANCRRIMFSAITVTLYESPVVTAGEFYRLAHRAVPSRPLSADIITEIMRCQGTAHAELLLLRHLVVICNSDWSPLNPATAPCHNVSPVLPLVLSYSARMHNGVRTALIFGRIPLPLFSNLVQHKSIESMERVPHSPVKNNIHFRIKGSKGTKVASAKTCSEGITFCRSLRYYDVSEQWSGTPRSRLQPEVAYLSFAISSGLLGTHNKSKCVDVHLKCAIPYGTKNDRTKLSFKLGRSSCFINVVVSQVRDESPILRDCFTPATKYFSLAVENQLANKWVCDEEAAFIIDARWLVKLLPITMKIRLLATHLYRRICIMGSFALAWLTEDSSSLRGTTGSRRESVTQGCDYPGLTNCRDTVTVFERLLGLSGSEYMRSHSRLGGERENSFVF